MPAHAHDQARVRAIRTLLECPSNPTLDRLTVLTSLQVQRHFLGSFLNSSLPTSYNLVLVALSYVIAALAGLLALSLTHRVARSQGLVRFTWLMSGALAMGLGIWLMHFQGMRALQGLPVITYDPMLLVISLLAPIGAAGLSLVTASRTTLTTRQILKSSLVMGGGITAMHYLGMASMRGAIHTHYQPVLVLASAGIAVAASAGALVLSHRHHTRRRSILDMIAASAVMAVAVTGMHYTGMSATSFTPAPDAPAGPSSSFRLEAVIAGVTVTLLLFALAGSLIQERWTSRRALVVQDERDFAHLVMESMGQGLALVDTRGVITFINATFAIMLRSTADALVGQHLKRVVGHDVEWEPLRNPASSPGSSPPNAEVTLFSAEAAPLHALLSTRNYTRADGRQGTIVILTDLTEQKRAEQALALEVAYAQGLVDIGRLTQENLEPLETAERAAQIVARLSNVDLGVLLHRQEAETHVLRVWESATGIADLNHLTDASAVLPDSVVSHPIYVENASQSTLVSAALRGAGIQTLAWIPVWDGPQEGYMYCMMRFCAGTLWSTRERSLIEAAATAVKVTIERQQYVRNIEQAALEDRLTGLRNRRAFDQDLHACLALAKRHQQTCALVLLDLNGLKRVNDSEGHARGDALLQAFASFLYKQWREGMGVYRLGGDEFAVLLPQASSGSGDVVLERVQQVGASTCAAGFPGTSTAAGIAFYPDDAETPEALFRKADKRMYAHKAAQRALVSCDS